MADITQQPVMTASDAESIGFARFNDVATLPVDIPDPPMVAYVYAADRKAERPEAHLGIFAGILQVDGYGDPEAMGLRNVSRLLR